MNAYSRTVITLAGIAALALSMLPTVGLADDGPLIGTWKLKQFVRVVAASGERYDQLGPHPEGVLSYSRDGRMSVLLLAGDRVKPSGDNPSDEEKLALYKTMIAYAGTYTVDGGKVVHHVDLSWNGARAGTDQVRFFALEGDTLTIRTAPNKSPIDGREGVGVLVFEKVK
jgi:Lipocalin-like domain